MRSGMLRHQVIIQRPNKAPDGMGGFTYTWVTHATIWANIKPLRGIQKIESMKVETEVTHQVQIRFMEKVQAGWRFILGARVFHILSVANVCERNISQELMCKEETP